MTYQLITPSDPITFKAESDKIAFFCALVLGSGKAGMEREDGEKCESRRPLTPAEIEFHAAWHGRVEIIKSVEEVTAFMRRVSCER